MGQITSGSPIRAERRLCEEVHLNLAYRRFCHPFFLSAPAAQTALLRQWWPALPPYAMGPVMPVSYARHRFPPEVIPHAVWLYLRFPLHYRDGEELLAERGLELSYATVRRWVGKFGGVYARQLRRSRGKPSPRWHLDAMVVRIGGKHL